MESAYDKKYKELTQNQVVIDDNNLRKISISAMDLLIQRNESGEFILNQEMLEFIRAIGSKYRIYLLTNMSKEP